MGIFSIPIIEGDILNSKETIICQQVNCMGVMGSGLAKHIYTKWPNVKKSYHQYCNMLPVDKLLGTVNLVGVGNCRFVANIFGQVNYGNRKDKVYTDYIALTKGLIIIKNELIDMSKDTLAIPYKIGCGLANGDWIRVYRIINEVFYSYEDRVNIYKFDNISNRKEK